MRYIDEALATLQSELHLKINLCVSLIKPVITALSYYYSQNFLLKTVFFYNLLKIF